MDKKQSTNDDKTLENLKTAMDAAVKHLSTLMHSKNKAVSRAACSDLLRHGLRAFELFELDERLNALEKIVEKQNMEKN